MIEATYERIGRSLCRLQSALREDGDSFVDLVERDHATRWESDALYHVLAVRTALMDGMQRFLVDEGLMNIERVQLSLVTDPLAHDVEHLPTVEYKGQPYVATHSMIYHKLLACHNPHLKGIFVDSPNIRLELEVPHRAQPGKHLVDFSQLDVEVRRETGITVDDYFDRPARVAERLRSDLHSALGFFEGMIRSGVERVSKRAGDSLRALGVTVELPEGPFPVYDLEEALETHPRTDVEGAIGRETGHSFFWITGILRENYDLVYPYLRRDGTRPAPREIAGADVFNFDLCARGTPLAGDPHPAREVMSGAIREWIPDAMVARMMDYGVIPEPPRIVDGEIENIERLGGYGPFLAVACRRGPRDVPRFPQTFGGGIGVERFLWSLLRGPCIGEITDVTFFGKNPDRGSLYLF